MDRGTVVLLGDFCVRRCQNKKWLEMEQSKHRKEDMTEMEDPRIDLCLFCVGPHRSAGGGSSGPHLSWTLLLLPDDPTTCPPALLLLLQAVSLGPEIHVRDRASRPHRARGHQGRHDDHSGGRHVPY